MFYLHYYTIGNYTATDAASILLRIPNNIYAKADTKLTTTDAKQVIRKSTVTRPSARRAIFYKVIYSVQQRIKLRRLARSKKREEKIGSLSTFRFPILSVC